MIRMRLRYYLFILVLFVSYVITNGGMMGNFLSKFTTSNSGFEPKSSVRVGRTNGTQISTSKTSLNQTFYKKTGKGEGSGRGYQTDHYQHYGWYQQNQNLDLYSLLGGLSFAGLLGATIIFLARRNTTGRRRRSLNDDDEDFSAHITDAIDDPWWEKNNNKVEPFKLV